MGAELRATWRLALPLAVAYAAQALMGIVDAAVVGRAGAVPLAGTGIGIAIFFAVTVVGMGVMAGLDPLVAQALGAGEDRRARHLFWQGTWLALALGAVFAVPLALATLLLEPIGIAPDVAAQARGFLWGRLPGLPAMFFFFAARSYVQAAGRARAVLASALIANVANLGLDVLLVFGGGDLPGWTGPLRAIPALHAAGSGIATTLATVVQAAALAWAAGRIPVDRRPSRRPAPSEIALAGRIGLPVGLHMAAEVGAFALVSLLSGRLGAVSAASHQVTIALASFTFSAAVGIGNAGSVRVGRAIGAGDGPGARRAGWGAFAAGASFMTACGLLFVACPGALARLMSDDPAVVAAATPLLRIAGLFQISDGIQGVGAGVLRGAADTRFTFAVNMVGHWALGFPAALLFGVVLGWGVSGLWWGLLIGLTAVAAGLVVRFHRISSREIVPVLRTGQMRGDDA